MPNSSSPWAARVAASLAANLLLASATLAAPAGVQALFATQAEAEKAAQLHFNCTGAHRMGTQWMPCAKHGDVQGSGHTH
jgi:hypothetical protein